MALVDRPREPSGGRRLPGAFQSLPPPVGITQLPPTVGEPPAGVAPSTQVDTAGRVAAARRHPLRVYSRPADRVGSSGRAVGRPRPAPGPGAGAGVVVVARVQVPSASVRVAPPAVLGRELPEVQVSTPEVTVEAPGVETARAPVALTARPWHHPTGW